MSNMSTTGSHVQSIGLVRSIAAKTNQMAHVYMRWTGTDLTPWIGPCESKCGPDCIALRCRVPASEFIYLPAPRVHDDQLCQCTSPHVACHWSVSSLLVLDLIKVTKDSCKLSLWRSVMCYTLYATRYTLHVTRSVKECSPQRA